MSVQDAYAPPRSAVRDVSGGSGLMTDRIVAALRKTRPWVLFLAVMGFIGAAFMAIAAIPMLLGASVGMMGGMEGMEGMEGMGMMGGGFMIGMGVLYLLFAVIYFFISLYLLRYAGAIKRAVAGLSLQDLEMALEHQASFWKLAGIMTLVAIVATIGALIVMIGGAVMMGGSM